jgi:hypothetical protein
MKYGHVRLLNIHELELEKSNYRTIAKRTSILKTWRKYYPDLFEGGKYILEIYPVTNVDKVSPIDGLNIRRNGEKVSKTLPFIRPKAEYDNENVLEKYLK